MKTTNTSPPKSDLGVFDFNEEIESVPTKWTPKCSSSTAGASCKPKFTDSVGDKYSFLQHVACGSDLELEIRVDSQPVDIDAFDIDDDDCQPEDEGHQADGSNCPADIVPLSPVAVSVEDHAADMIKGTSSGIALGQSPRSLGELRSTADLDTRNDSDGDASSDVVDNSEESSHSTPTSVLIENNVASERQPDCHSCHDVEMEDADSTVLLDADYVCYRNRYYPASSVLFSSSSFKIVVFCLQEEVENSQSEWNLDDIVSIWSQWSSKTGTATIRLFISIGGSYRVGASPNISDTEELEAVIHDPNWFQTQAKIVSLNLKYKDLWITKPNIDQSHEREILPGDSVYHGGPYFPDFDEHCQEVIYPEGDADAVSISKRDVDLLLPETFVNDTIIDFYIKYLKNRIPAEEIHRFHFFNSFFFRKLADLDKNPSSVFEGKAAFQRVRKWTRKIDLFGKDYIFIPVNYNLHWSLIVICHPGEVADFEDGGMSNTSRVPCILHMDSIRGSHTGLRNLMQSYLCEEWKERRKEISEDVESKFLNLRFLSLELPQQENCYDCGLFLLHYVELFVEEASVEFSPFKITKFSNFLSSDWFLPSEVSLKRGYIQRLICDLLQKHARAGATASSDNEHQSSDLPEIGGNDRSDDLFSSRSISRKASGNSLYDLSRQEFRMDVLGQSSLRNCDGSYGAMREIFEEEAYNLGSCSRLANARSHTEVETDEDNPFMPMKRPSIPEYMLSEAENPNFSYQYGDLGAGIPCDPEISDDSEDVEEAKDFEEAEDAEEADEVEDMEDMDESVEGMDDAEEAEYEEGAEAEDVSSPISDYNSDGPELEPMVGAIDDGHVPFEPDEDGHAPPLRDDVDHVDHVDHVIETPAPCEVSAASPDVGKVQNGNDEGYPSSHGDETPVSICEPVMNKNKHLTNDAEHLIVDDSSSDSDLLHVAKRLRLSPPSKEEHTGCEAGEPQL